jgi:hypothetical protein
MRKLTFLAGLTAGLMYFFDRDQGNRRRAVAKDRIAAFGRRLVRRGESAGGGAASQAQALKAKATHLREEPKELDDVTLARKVESELFRDSKSLKGKIDVNAVDGTVWLRGSVKNPAEQKAVEAKVRSIPEVSDVENLLHLPKTPAPTRQKAKPAAKREKKAQPRRFTKVASDDQTTRSASGEPTPAETAREGSGRKPAPLGAGERAATSPTGGTTPTTGGTTPSTGGGP